MGHIARPTRAAFFDVDNTMVMGASIYYFARGLAARKYVRVRDLIGFAVEQARFRAVGAESATGMNRARDAALAFVAGRSVADISAAGEEIYDELMADRMWEGTVEIAKAHLAAGDDVWLVTATPIELAAIIAKRLGLTGALGTRAEVIDGRYTGRLIGSLLHGPGKAAAITELAAERSYNLDHCVAYSDSSNDLPMLRTVGTAVAINPDRELRRVAAANDWVVYDFRGGRKAAQWGLPTGAAVVAALAVGFALWQRRRRR